MNDNRFENIMIIVIIITFIIGIGMFIYALSYANEPDYFTGELIGKETRWNDHYFVVRNDTTEEASVNSGYYYSNDIGDEVTVDLHRGMAIWAIPPFFFFVLICVVMFMMLIHNRRIKH